MRQTVQMSIKKRPIDLCHERGSESVVDRMKPSAAKRYYSRVFKEAKLKPGDKVYVSLTICARWPLLHQGCDRQGYQAYKQQYHMVRVPFNKL